MGTASGLNLYQPETDNFSNFSGKDMAALNGFIHSMLGDERGRLWLATNKGLVRYDPVLDSLRSYDRHDGLQSNEFNSGAAFAGPDAPKRWYSFVPSMEFADGRLKSLTLTPIELAREMPRSRRGYPRVAQGREARRILDRVGALSKPYRTKIATENGKGTVRLG